jgi:hypothetical protein
MKKIIGLLSLIVVITAMSCTDQTKETKKEVIVVPAPAPAPAPVIIVKDPPATTISIDKNGVKVETKKVKVNLEKQQ